MLTAVAYEMMKSVLMTILLCVVAKSSRKVRAPKEINDGTVCHFDLAVVLRIGKLSAGT